MVRYVEMAPVSVQVVNVVLHVQVASSVGMVLVSVQAVSVVLHVLVVSNVTMAGVWIALPIQIVLDVNIALMEAVMVVMARLDV